MARFMVSMPDAMVKELDLRAQMGHRTRSELLREAVRHHLAASAPAEVEEGPGSGKKGKRKAQKRWTKKTLEEYLLEKGWARRGSPGLTSLLGPVRGTVDMEQVLRVTKKLKGLSRQIIDERDDRV